MYNSHTRIQDQFLNLDVISFNKSKIIGNATLQQKIFLIYVSFAGAHTYKSILV